MLGKKKLGKSWQYIRVRANDFKKVKDKNKRQENILKNDGNFHGYLLFCVAGGF